MTGSALVIIEAQVNKFAGSQPVFQAEEILKNLSALAQKARFLRIPVIFIMNEGGPGEPDAPGETGWLLHSELGPTSGDMVLPKHTPDSFMGTQLYEILEEGEIDHLIIAGFRTEISIRSTVSRALEIGYQVTLVSDAHSTIDQPDQISARDTINQLNLEFAATISVLPHDLVQY